MGKEFDFEKVLPTNNVMFSMIFGDERHPRILIHFLNSVIKPVSPIKAVHIRKEHKPNQAHVSEKGVRLDIVADTDSGEIINVEMQLSDEKNMPERSLFYWSKLFAGQLVVGDDYRNLKRTILINVLKFTFFKDDNRYWRKGYLSDEQNGEKFTDRLEMHFIEIDKMREMKQDSPITFWVEFFKDPYSEKVKELCEFVPEIKEAKEVFERAKYDPEAQESMRVLEKFLMDKAASITSAKREGKAEGMAEGLAEGKEKGRSEEKIAIARSLMAQDVDIKTVSKATGLTEEQIREVFKQKT